MPKEACVHEMGVAAEAYRLSRERLGDAGGRLVRVHLAVGELSAVEPDLLRFAWTAVPEGGPDGAALASSGAPRARGARSL